MFGKKKYKYFISFWYQLELGNYGVRDAYMEMNKKINIREHIPQIRRTLKDQVEKETGEKCNCIGIVNWKRLR